MSSSFLLNSSFLSKMISLVRVYLKHTSASLDHNDSINQGKGNYFFFIFASVLLKLNHGSTAPSTVLQQKTCVKFQLFTGASTTLSPKSSLGYLSTTERVALY